MDTLFIIALAILAIGVLLCVVGALFFFRIKRRSRQQAAELRVISAISRAIQSNRNPNSLLSVVAEQVTELLRVGNLTIALYDASRGMVHFPLALRDHRPDSQDTRPVGSGLIDQVIQTGQALLIENRVDERARQMGLTSPEFPISSWMGVPLSTGDRTWGVLAVASSASHREFSPQDMALLSVVAAQTAIALDNVQLNWAARDRSTQLLTLHAARDRMQVILDTMNEAVILIDGEGRIVLANPRVYPLLGLETDKIVGQTVFDLVNDQALCLAERLGFEPAELLAQVRRVSNSRRGVTIDSQRSIIEISSAVQERVLDRTLIPTRDGDGATVGLLMAFTDVTEEHALAQARQDLSSMIVHDLRGPLTAISASLKLLREIAPDGDPLGRAIYQTTEAASRAMRKLLSLVDSLLDVSKMESGAIELAREPAMLSRMCAAVVDDLMPVARELDVVITLAVAHDLPLVDVDLDKVERVLLNLVDNAIKFTPSGGTVTVRAYAPSAGSRHIRVEVADTGPGIPDEHKERLFNRFAQLPGQRGRRRGTGLGLTFCKLTVDAHEGAIWIEDNPQGGSIFVFTLPAVVVENRLLQHIG